MAIHKDKLKFLARFIRDNKNNQHKILLQEYLQDLICKYSCDTSRPAEQIKGMNVLLRDIIDLDSRLFEGK